MKTQKTPKSPLTVENEILRDEIQQLKNEVEIFRNAYLSYVEKKNKLYTENKLLKRQIETAKQILKKHKVGYYSVQFQVQDLRKLFGEKTPDNYSGDYDEYAERSSEENTET